MSRCFPYPPPGYTPKSSGNEALIKSIKLQREIEKAKAERKKEKKREKKEKKREKDEKRKRKPIDFLHGEEVKLNDKKIHKKDTGDLKGRSTEKKRKNEAEQLERSDITEEHDQPTGSQNPCYSCDSTQNSNKRRRHSPHSDGSHNHGSIIRIRLPLQKTKESVALASEERANSTSRRVVSPAQHESGVAHGPSGEEPCSTSTETGIINLRGVTHGPDKERSSASARTISFSQDSMQTTSVIKSFGNGMTRKESLYKDLIETLLPPLQSHQAEFDDDEWLFGRKLQDNQRDKRCAASSSDVSSCATSTLWWPRAQYLAEADIYALPFTVPY